MENIKTTEQVTDDQYYEALADSLFHFDQWLNQIQDGDVEDQSEELARFDERYVEFKNGILRQVYQGFDAGFRACYKLFEVLFFDENIKSSESTATTTETTK